MLALTLQNTVQNLTELSDVHDVVFVLENSGLVVVDIQIVRRAENGHDAWEACSPCLPVHSVACILSFMRTDDGQQVIFFEETARCGIGEEVRATADIIVDKELLRLFLSEVFQRIRPQDVAHQSVSWGFAKSINLPR